MQPTKKVLWAFFFLLPLFVLNAGNALAQNSGDEDSEIKARVARISFVRGDVQIKHADSDDWERATRNYPVVEGDEITADAESRLEIQFDTKNYLRLSENAYLKITTLRDEGVAVSLPRGTLSLRVLEFDKDREFFEIDAPQITVAVQKAGMYRVDAGDKNDNQIRVSVTDDGQARVYSEDSGFTLHSGKSAQIFLDGNNKGEWETSDAARYADEFDSWALERDAVIAKRLRDAHYDKYYDRDIYGAEDLSEYGEWINTRKYGYVWRPFRNATSSYADWSPYRYGEWRWIPPYGWTWVNDEPWGWATYHHGRWVYVDDDWAWTPYSQHRVGRSWWKPALVVVTYSGSLICWYPLPYQYNYYNYNHYSSTYVDRRKYNTTVINNTTVIVNPTPTPAITRANSRKKLPPSAVDSIADVPVKGVVGVPASKFGLGEKVFRTPSNDVARKVLSESPSDIKSSPTLPVYKDLSAKISKDIRVENPKLENFERRVKIGAADRRAGISVDDNLRKERIYGNRPAIERNADDKATKGSLGVGARDTGAVRRVPRPVTRDEENPRKEKSSRDNNKIRSTGGDSDDRRQDAPVRRPRQDDRDERPSPPISIAPRRERKERSEPPVSEQPRRDEAKPKRKEPRQQPPPVRESKPKERDDNPPEKKSTPPPIESRKAKDETKDE